MQERKEFKLLVRLLTGIHNYIDLQEIFNVLIENDSFELLLRKDLLRDEAEQTELRLAIFRYLQSNHPRDTSKLDLLYISFKMYRERADDLVRQADFIIQKIGEYSSRTPQHAQDVNEAITLLLDASDCYAKEKCFRLSEKALRTAALLSVQLSTPHLNMLNLSNSNKDALMWVFVRIQSVDDARDFADAYAMNFDNQWIEALYYQVICKTNFLYFNEYLSLFPVSPALWEQMTAKVRATTLL